MRVSYLTSGFACISYLVLEFAPTQVKRIGREDEGFLTFEWIILLTLLVIGIAASIGAVRDAINTEFVNVTGAIVSVDQSYSVCNPIEAGAGSGTTGSGASCCFGQAAGVSFVRKAPSYGATRTSFGNGVGSCSF